MVCHYWYFKDVEFKFERHLCNKCNDVLMTPYEVKIISIFKTKGVDFICILWDLRSDEAVNHCMKIRIFVLRKFVKRTEKIIFSLVFVCFRFTEISYFLNFPSNENVRKQHLSANAYSCVNMKFSYTIAVRKDEIFYVVLLRKQAIFHLRLSQLFVDDI